MHNMLNHIPFRSALMISTSVIAAVILGFALSQFSFSQPVSWPLPTMTLAALIALWGPLWQLSLNSPRINIELLAIERKLSENAFIDTSNAPEFAVFARAANHRFFAAIDVASDIRRNGIGHDIDKLEKFINITEGRIADLQTLTNGVRDDVKIMESKYNKDNFSAYDCEVLSRPLEVPVTFNEKHPEKSLDQIFQAHNNRISSLDKLFDDLTKNLPSAKARIKEIRREYSLGKSYFLVDAAIINSGHSSTSVKPLALLRINIGASQHVDLELELVEMKQGADVLARNAKFITLRSREISSLTDASRNLINRYWNNDNSAKMLMHDIYSATYISNDIVFADGLYRKHFYDKLEYYANNDELKKKKNSRSR